MSHALVNHKNSNTDGLREDLGIKKQFPSPPRYMTSMICANNMAFRIRITSKILYHCIKNTIDNYRYSIINLFVFVQNA